MRVARRFVVRQAPGGEWEAEEHAVEYDTEDSLDVLHFQIFSLTSVSPDLQKVRSLLDRSSFPGSSERAADAEW